MASRSLLSLLFLLLACLPIYVVARSQPADHSSYYAVVRARQNANDSSSLLATASSQDIAAARQIVKDAIAEASIRNKARLDNPARNQ
jgi:hypothetical protein